MPAAAGGIQREGAHRLDVEAARVVEVLRQPEQVEVPGGVAQELRDDEAPGLPEAQELQPAQRRLLRAGRGEHRLELRALRVAELRVPLGREVVAPPPDRPDEAERAGEEEDPAPVGVTDSISAISGGATTMPTAVPAFMMPMAVERSCTGNHSATTRVAAGKPPPSPDAQQQPAGAPAWPTLVARPWLAQASDQKTMMTVKPAARAQHVHQLAAAGVHQRVGEQERRLQQRELLVGDRDVPLDGLDGHRQRLPVEIADGDRRADEDGDPPASGDRGQPRSRSPLQHDERDRLARQREAAASPGPSSTRDAWPAPSIRGELAGRLELRVLLRVGRDRRAHPLPGRVRVAVALVDAVVRERAPRRCASGRPLSGQLDGGVGPGHVVVVVVPGQDAELASRRRLASAATSGVAADAVLQDRVEPGVARVLSDGQALGRPSGRTCGRR